MGELLQAQEKKMDSPLEIMDQLALVKPVQVWAQEKQPHWVSPVEVEL